MAEHQPMGDFRPPTSYDDPSANLWLTYLSKSEQYDRTMAQNWKSDMDAILIFAGLFSASLTAFIVESYKTLNPDPGSATAFLLGQLLLQHPLSNTSSGPDLSFLNQFDQNNFSAPVSSVICNVLWFLSLGFSLVCALSATLVEQWTRQYLQASTSKPAPQDRARMSAYLNEGIKKYKMATIVETIPLLLHISLFLFFAGLVFFLSAVNPILQYLMLALLICCCLLYILVTVLPVVELSCPYWTPLSSRCWALFRRLGLLSWRDVDGNISPVAPQMTTAREMDAIEITPERDDRDLEAMCWTLSNLREDNEFEPFVEVIPSVVSGFDYSAKWLMDCLTKHNDISIKLGHRIPGLLATCNVQLLDPAAAQKRAITCLNAIWSLTMLSIPNPRNTQKYTSLRGNVIFKEDTFDLLAKVQHNIPAVEPHVVSTSVVIARSLLDMYVDRATTLENDIITLLETGQLPEPLWNPNKPETVDVLAFSDIHEVFKASQSRIKAAEIEVQLAATKNLTRPFPYVLLEGLIFHQTRLVAMASIPSSIFGLDRTLLLEALSCVKSFQAILNQTGLNLSLQFLENMLQSKTLPHEAFNTLRRTFFRIDFGMRFNRRSEAGNVISINYGENMTFSKDSQERLVSYLEEAVEPTTSQIQNQTQTQTTRLPHPIIGIILNLAGRALSDPTLMLKAIGIIENYAKFHDTNDSVPKALQNLMQFLPVETRGANKPLDLFSSHISIDAKAERTPMKSRPHSTHAIDRKR